MPKTHYKSPKPAYQTTAAHAQPPMGSTAVFAWETFSPLSDYSDHRLLQVFKQISSDIIERPYHYDPHHLFNAQGQALKHPHQHAGNTKPPAKIPGVAVYKQNHGTGHALRQMVYTDALINVIAQEGTPKGQALAEKVNRNPQVKSALKLAAYCKRIGRTFDHEHDAHAGMPTIYSKRSAEMFAKIATELGYDQELIRIISDGMLEPAPKNPELMNSYQNIAGISGRELRYFTENVLMAAHMADLARLFSVRRNYIENTLKYYFEPTKLKEVATGLVEMACKANTLTGNAVVRQEQGVKHQQNSIDGKKLVWVVNHLEQALEALTKLTSEKGILKTKAATKPAPPVTQSHLKDEANIQLKTALAAHKTRFTALLGLLTAKEQQLRHKAKHHEQYIKVSKAITRLTAVLQQEQSFFEQPTPAKFKEFKQNIERAMHSAASAAKNQRGWHTIHPIIRGLVGILAAIAVIPALVIIAKSQHGFTQTFFGKPHTATSQKVAALAEEMEGIDKTMEGSRLGRSCKL